MIFRNSGKSAQERADQAESWSGYATLLIFAGIIAEIALLFIFPHGLSSLERWSLVGSNAAIGIGLIIEFFCIHRAVKANRELKIESDVALATALDRAARAETELIEFRRPRRALMTAENRAKLAERLSLFAGTEFDTGVGSGGEQIHFLWDLEEVLATARWVQLPWGVHAVGILTKIRNQRPLAGVVDAQNVEIHLDPAWRQQRLPAAQALIAGLREIGIAADEETSYTVPNTNEHVIHILIGPKG